MAEEIGKLEKRRKAFERDLSSSKKSLKGCEDKMYELMESRGSCEQRIICSYANASKSGRGYATSILPMIYLRYAWIAMESDRILLKNVFH